MCVWCAGGRDAVGRAVVAGAAAAADSLGLRPRLRCLELRNLCLLFILLVLHTRRRLPAAAHLCVLDERLWQGFRVKGLAAADDHGKALGAGVSRLRKALDDRAVRQEELPRKQHPLLELHRLLHDLQQRLDGGACGRHEHNLGARALVRLRVERARQLDHLLRH